MAPILRSSPLWSPLSPDHENNRAAANEVAYSSPLHRGECQSNARDQDSEVVLEETVTNDHYHSSSPSCGELALQSSNIGVRTTEELERYLAESERRLSDAIACGVQVSTVPSPVAFKSQPGCDDKDDDELSIDGLKARLDASLAMLPSLEQPAVAGLLRHEHNEGERAQWSPPEGAQAAVVGALARRTLDLEELDDATLKATLSSVLAALPGCQRSIRLSGAQQVPSRRATPKGTPGARRRDPELSSAATSSTITSSVATSSVASHARHSCDAAVACGDQAVACGDRAVACGDRSGARPTKRAPRCHDVDRRAELLARKVHGQTVGVKGGGRAPTRPAWAAAAAPKGRAARRHWMP